MINALKIILYLLISVLLLSCNKYINHSAADNSQRDISTGVKGQVFISPVSHINQSGITGKVPYEAFLKFLDPDKKIIKRIQTNEEGKFEIALDAGHYTIIPEPINNTGYYPTAEKKDITLVPGKIMFVEIDFDSGIR